MNSEWIQCHSTLFEGKHRGIPRAARCVLLELSLRSRRGHGVIDLPLGMTDEEGVCDILGGDRDEVLECLKFFAAGDDPTIVFAGPPGGRALIFPRWSDYNSTKEKASKVSARVKRLRARKDALLAEWRATKNGPSAAGPRGADSSLPLFSSAVLDPVPEKTEVTGDRAREAPPTPEAPSPPAPPTTPVPPDRSEQAHAVLTTLNARPELRQVATLAFAERIASFVIFQGKTLEGVLGAVNDAADKAGALADTGNALDAGRITAMVLGFVKAPPRAGPSSGVGRRGAYEVQRSPGYDYENERSRRDARLEEGKAKHAAKVAASGEDLGF